MTQLDRLERKVDRLSLLVATLILLELGFRLFSWWQVGLGTIVVLAAVYLLFLSPAMRALFPAVGQRVMSFHRWLIQRGTRRGAPSSSSSD